jgi:hypothetical protein
MYQRIALTIRRRVVVLVARDGRWMATIDGLDLPDTFPTSADAWTAAVREAERLDGLIAAARMMRR